MMAKMTVSLTKMAEQAGLDMDVSVSVDMTETRFRFSGPAGRREDRVHQRTRGDYMAGWILTRDGPCARAASGVLR